MYKNLDNQKMTSLQGSEPSAKGTCTCSCKSPQPLDEKPVPKVATAATQGSVYFHINGGKANPQNR